MNVKNKIYFKNVILIYLNTTTNLNSNPLYTDQVECCSFQIH